LRYQTNLEKKQQEEKRGGLSWTGSRPPHSSWRYGRTYRGSSPGVKVNKKKKEALLRDESKSQFKKEARWGGQSSRIISSLRSILPGGESKREKGSSSYKAPCEQTMAKGTSRSLGPARKRIRMGNSVTFQTTVGD